MASARKVCPIIKGRLYFTVIRGPQQKNTAAAHYFCIDQALCYEPFYQDFGPLNLGHFYRFQKVLNAKLKSAKYKGKKIYFYTTGKPQFKANAAAIIGCFAIKYLGMNWEKAYAPLAALEPYMPFRDASMGPCPYKLTVKHVLQGMQQAVRFNFFDFDTFNVDEYEYFECVENGDLNMIIPGKFMAFSGPHRVREGPDGYPQLTPEDYLPIFRKYEVTTVIRLNMKMYDARDFIEAGYSHYDMFFIDGTTPSLDILDHFIEVCEKHDGVLAVHCKAGLGRTGTTIGCYMMKHYRMTAAECIAWIRICRPGSVIGPQQDFLESQQDRMWAAGDAWRAERGLPAPGSEFEEDKQGIEDDLNGMALSSKGKATKSRRPVSSVAKAPPSPAKGRASKPRAGGSGVVRIRSKKRATPPAAGLATATGRRARTRSSGAKAPTGRMATRRSAAGSD